LFIIGQYPSWFSQSARLLGYFLIKITHNRAKTIETNDPKSIPRMLKYEVIPDHLLT